MKRAPSETSEKRNRSAEAAVRGRVMRAFELSPEADAAVGALAAHYHASGRVPNCTRTQAVEIALRLAAKRIRKKARSGLDTD